MENLIIRICLPRGMATVSGAALKDDTTFEVVSTINPWYCSIDQVRLESGSFIRNSSDITVASSIYTMGRETDTMLYKQAIIPPAGALPTDVTAQRYQRFVIGRQRFVILSTAYRLVMNFWDINSSHGSKTLGNFSVHRQSDDEVPKKLAELKEGSEGWKIVVQSGGAIGYEGRVSAVTAAKGLYGDPDVPAGRTWMTTGMGANRKSIAGYGADGKPVKFGSPSVIQWRVGRYMGGYLSVVPKFMGGM